MDGVFSKLDGEWRVDGDCVLSNLWLRDKKSKSERLSIVNSNDPNNIGVTYCQMGTYIRSGYYEYSWKKGSTFGKYVEEEYPAHTDPFFNFANANSIDHELFLKNNDSILSVKIYADVYFDGHDCIVYQSETPREYHWFSKYTGNIVLTESFQGDANETAHVTRIYENQSVFSFDVFNPELQGVEDWDKNYYKYD